ncbi:hypothetical protein [Raoultella sp. RIT712]|uniref:hypothetical protein n=1 Tax=Raoultella sp. RIT712 TaxID=2666191 RepID=UPI0012AD3A25|nr:hypothetical protein [Raoultella sp. RIT712]MRT50596.1 hypothetical protein [Raoultella sp. RIT712]
MKAKNENKYGLTRYIDAEKARKIRRDAGYGCVICGVLFTDYEHIDPEFHVASEHDPEKMTLLCGTHHDDVSYKRLTKQDVWDAKKNPYNKKHKSLYAKINPQGGEASVKFGSNTIGSGDGNNVKINQVAMKLYGKPILWFENKEQVDSPIQVCAIFYNKNKHPHAYVNRNIFRRQVDECDIEAIGHRIKIRIGLRDIALTLNFEGGEHLVIEYFKMEYIGGSITIDSNGSMFMKNDVGGNIQLSSSSINSLNICQVPKTNRIGDGVRSRISNFIKTVINGFSILAFNGERVGWLLDDDFVVNKEYVFTGKAVYFNEANSMVSNLVEPNFANLFASETSNGDKVYQIGFDKDSYDSGEPIWISSGDRDSVCARNKNIYDLGYRLFDNEDVYN